MMTTPLSVIRFINFGITALLLGMGSTACQAFPKNAATPALPKPYTPPEYKKPPLTEEEKAWAAMPYEDQVEFMIKKRPRLKFLLSEKSKFRQMGTACNLSPRTPQEKAIPSGLYHFMGPYKVTSNDLLLIGECSFNTTYVTRNVVVFHYNTQAGVNPIPLQLMQPTPTDPNASAHYFRERPSAFNEQTGELVFTLPCLIRHGLQPRQYRYRFQEGQLVLQEAFWDNRKSCNEPPQWTQIYP